MTGRDRLELLSAALDGELDEADRARLDALLESPGNASEVKAGLERVDALLRSAPVLDPPETLKSRIMEEAGRRRKVSAQPPGTSWWRQLFPGAGIRYAVAASAGAVVAAVIINGEDQVIGPISATDVTGTLAPESEGPRSNIVDSYEFSRDGTESLIQLRLADDVPYLDINSDAAGRLDISVDLQGTGLEPNAITHIEGRSRSIALADQKILLSAEGRQRTSIMLRNSDGAQRTDGSSIALEVSSDGKLLEQGTIAGNW